MKNKKNRLQLILELIKTQRVGCQEDLVKLLAERDFKVTQATLSRDLKKLRVTKVATDSGEYIYIVPNSNDVKDTMLTVNQGPSNPNNSVGFVSLTFSGRMAVIKTRNGYAGGLAYDIDMSNAPEILGTIPGSDTIFAVLREGVTKEEAIEAFGKMLPLDKKHHYK